MICAVSASGSSDSNAAVCELVDNIWYGINLQLDAVSETEEFRQYIIREIVDLMRDEALSTGDISRISALSYQYMESLNQLGDSSAITRITESSICNLSKAEISILWDRIGTEDSNRMREYVKKLSRVLVADLEARREDRKFDISSHVVDYLVRDTIKSIPLTVVPQDGHVIIVNSPELAEWLGATGWVSTIDSISTTIANIAELTGNRTRYSIDMSDVSGDLCVCLFAGPCCSRV